MRAIGIRIQRDRCGRQLSSTVVSLMLLTGIVFKKLIDDGICILHELYQEMAPQHVKFIPLRGAKEYMEYFIWVKQDNPCLNVLVQEVLVRFNQKMQISIRI